MSYVMFNREARDGEKIAISITKAGILIFNRGATDFLRNKSIRSIILLWDKENRQIGIHPITDEYPHSYNLPWSEKRNHIRICVVGFLSFIEYDASETRSFIPIWNEQQFMFEIKVQKEHFRPGGYVMSYRKRKKLL